MSGNDPTIIVATAPAVAETVKKPRATPAQAPPRAAENTLVMTVTPTRRSRKALKSSTRENVRKWFLRSLLDRLAWVVGVGGVDAGLNECRDDAEEGACGAGSEQRAAGL
jgi:hypothetical protein